MSYNKLFLAGIMFLFSVSCFFSCKQDDTYKAVVTVFRLDETGTEMRKIPVPNCKLIFGEDKFDADIYREVYTDATGKYEGVWKREVSLRIQASAEINDKMYTGASFIRLSLGATEEREVLVTEEK